MHKAFTALPLFVAAALIAASKAVAGFEGASTGVNLGDPSDPFDKFDAILRVGLGQDDNVQLAPDLTSFGTATDSTFVDAELNAVFRHRFNPMLVGGAGLRVDATGYLDEIAPSLQPMFGTFTDYNRIAVNPSLFVDALLDGVDARFAYDFRFEDADNVGAIGLYGHRISIALSRDIDVSWRVRGGLSHAWNDFTVVFPEPENDRDGTLTAATAGVDYFIAGGYTVLSLTLAAMANDTKGDNWDYAGHGATLGARTVLMPHLFASGDLGYEWRDYHGFASGFITPPGRKEQGIFSAKAKLVYQIDERFSVDAFVVYADHTSNQPEFEGDHTIVGAGITTKLY